MEQHPSHRTGSAHAASDTRDVDAMSAEFVELAKPGTLTVLDLSAMDTLGVGTGAFALAVLDRIAGDGGLLVWTDSGGKHDTGQWLAQNFASPALLAVSLEDTDVPDRQIPDCPPPSVAGRAENVLARHPQNLRATMLIIDADECCEPLDVSGKTEQTAELIELAERRPHTATVVTVFDRATSRPARPAAACATYP